MYLSAPTAIGLSAAVLVPVALICLQSYPHIKSSCARYLWTLRAITPGLRTPLPRKLENWRFTAAADEDMKQLISELDCFLGYWKFLEPFFASRGYIFYVPFKSYKTMLVARPSDATIRKENIPVYPYARRVYKQDNEATFSYGSLQVWPARDRLGRDVIIKIVADDTTSNERSILQILNTKEMRQDPRNHTIPIIEFIRFQQYTFVVMPRWHDGLLRLDFGTVNEVLFFAQSILEAFDFLHEHRIVHLDFLEQHVAINVLADVNKWGPGHLGLLHPSVTRYVLIDFGNSTQYPLDIPIDEVQDTHFFNFGLHHLPEHDGPYNPFHVEMFTVGRVLQRRVRHIENIIPELGPFFDAMTDIEATKRPSAHQALTRFKGIYSNLSEAKLNQNVVSIAWQDGVIELK